MNEIEFKKLRKELVESMVRSGYLKKEAIKKAFLNVKREVFFPKEIISSSYVDSAFPIGFGQTISQPSTIAVMLELLDVKLGMKVLEVGSGCGYVLALLSELVGEKGFVLGIDLVPELVEVAKKNLVLHGNRNVEVIFGDGTKGWKAMAPFDRILISAATSKIPKALIEQLKESGKLVAPIGNSWTQEIKAFEKKKGKLKKIASIGYFAFVPLREGKE